MSHPYEIGFNPPAPFVTIEFRNPNGMGPIESLRALVDSGSDQTILPPMVAHRLGLISLGRIPIGGYSGRLYLDEYLVQLCIDTFAPLTLNVLAAPPGQPPLVGRDVLNRYRVTLDGPNQRLEIA